MWTLVRACQCYWNVAQTCEMCMHPPPRGVCTLAESTGAGREGETAAGPRPKKARRGGRAPHPLPNQRKASGGRTEGIRGPLRTEGGRPDGEASRGDVE